MWTAPTIVEATRNLTAAETLFIISSKTFTTLETMTNARTARQWTLDALGNERAISRHFVAVSTTRAGRRVGIDTNNVSASGTGWSGRSSIDSAIGLSTMIAVGPEHFRAMLAQLSPHGQAFPASPFETNLPVLMGTARSGRATFSASTVAVLPYDRSLKTLPAYLQQLTMESNRKRAPTASAWTINRADLLGRAHETMASPSFYQLIHQGTHLIPATYRLRPDPEPVRGIITIC